MSLTPLPSGSSVAQTLPVTPQPTPPADPGATIAAADPQATDPAAVTPEEKKDDKFAPKFAALAKRERAIVTREAQTKAKEKELETKYAPLMALEKEALESPQATAEKLWGKDWYQKLTNLVISDGKKGPEWEIESIKRQLKDKDDAEKKRVEDTAEKSAKDQAERVERETQDYVSKVRGFLTENAETYEFLNAHPEGAEIVFNVIEKHYVDTEKLGEARVLTVQEASEHAEKLLEEEAMKLTSLKKIKAKFGAPIATDPKPVLTKDPKTTTLTNSIETSAPTPKDIPTLSIDESRHKAATMLRWT